MTVKRVKKSKIKKLKTEESKIEEPEVEELEAKESQPETPLRADAVECTLADFDTVLSEIQLSPDATSETIFNTMHGIRLLMETRIKSNILNKQVHFERIWDLNNPIQDASGKVIGYNLIEIRKIIIQG
jgi:hypothetical protein